MDVEELEIVELELKYCERCGALWLRPCGGEQAYCAQCTVKMLNPPIVRSARARRRWKLNEHLGDMASDGRSVLLEEGGNA